MSNALLLAKSFLKDAEDELLSLPKSISDREIFEVERNLERARVNIDEAPPSSERDNLLLAYYALMGRVKHYRGERDRRLEIGKGQRFFQGAIEFYEQALQIRETQYVLYELALSLDASGQTSRAILLLERAAQIDPETRLGIKAAKAAQIMKETGSPGGGCFIATACYGDADHVDVVSLRRFRDRHLLTNLLGRALIALYYSISPPLAGWLSSHQRAAELLRKVVLAPAATVVRAKRIT